MLDRLTPAEFEERWNHYQLEPWGDEWLIGSTIAASIFNAIRWYAMAKNGQKIPDGAMVQPADFIPSPDWLKEELEAQRRKSDEDIERMMTW